MKTHLIDAHLLVPRSRSSAKVKVKYQGHVSQKMGASAALVFHKHILSHNVFHNYISLVHHAALCGNWPLLLKVSASKEVKALNIKLAFNTKVTDRIFNSYAPSLTLNFLLIIKQMQQIVGTHMQGSC